MHGDFTIDGIPFQWDDGIFSITLGNRNSEGYRTAFFHPMASTSEFGVSTKVLQNEQNAGRDNHGNDFQVTDFRMLLSPFFFLSIFDSKPNKIQFVHQIFTVSWSERAKYTVNNA